MVWSRGVERYSTVESAVLSSSKPVVFHIRHLDEFAHFEQARASAHPNAFLEEEFSVEIGFQSRAALISRFGIAQVGGDDGGLPIVAAVRDDGRHGVFHPVRDAMCAQIVEQQNVGIECGFVGFAVHGAGGLIVATADAVEKGLKVKEHSFESTFDQSAQR